jgi:hypothetical protein
MTSKGIPVILVFFVAINSAGCGNYSNEDLDFQLALPEQSDIAAKMQAPVPRADSAEYYVATRSAIKTFNAIVVDLTGLIDVIRGNTPTSRNGNQRTWGPFADDNHPGWEIRVVMQRSSVSASLLHMDYWVQVRPVNQGDAAWVSFLTGNYDSQGSARTGKGEIQLLANDARVAGYPVDEDPGLVDLDNLDVKYSNAGYPITVTMTIQNLPSAKTQSGFYAYSQNQDGSGTMEFDWQGVTDTGVQITATMTSRWLDSGAGRADLAADLTPNSPSRSTLLGTDCWGADTVTAYSYRLSNNPGIGTPDLCQL